MPIRPNTLGGEGLQRMPNSSLNLGTQVTGNYPATAFAGTPSSDTYLCSGTGGTSTQVAWRELPSVAEGQQGMFLSTIRDSQPAFGPLVTPTLGRSIVGTSTSGGFELQLNDGQFPYSQSGFTIVAGTFSTTVRDGGFVQAGPNSLVVDWLPQIFTYTANASLTLSNTANTRAGNIVIIFFDNTAPMTLNLSFSGGAQRLYFVGRGTANWTVSFASSTLLRLTPTSITNSSPSRITSANPTDAMCAYFASATQFCAIGTPQSTGFSVL